MSKTIQCRASVGVPIVASKPWKQGEQVRFIHAPAGVHTITAGTGRNDCVTITVNNDEQTARDLQASFERLIATNKQQPYADEDHESKKATLRFPADTTFTWGEIKGEEGVIVSAEPTSYGAEAVNGKVYTSWSPEFSTNADFSKAICLKCNEKPRNCDCDSCHIGFPDGVRGSESNPARIVSVGFVIGALTNKPAFHAMPPVKARRALGHDEESDAARVHHSHHGIKAEHHRKMSELYYGLHQEHHRMHLHHASLSVNEEGMGKLHQDPNAIANAEIPHSPRGLRPKTHTASSPLDALIEANKTGDVVGGYLIKAADGTGTFPTTKGGRPDHDMMSTAWGDLQKFTGPGKDEALALLRALFASEHLDFPRTKEQEIFAGLVASRTGTPAACT